MKNYEHTWIYEENNKIVKNLSKLCFYKKKYF